MSHQPEVELTDIRGALRRNFSFWKTLTLCPDILRVVERGYAPLFNMAPPPFSTPNNQTAKDHSKFMFGALAELFLNRFAELVDEPPSVINPFSVSIRANRKKWLIADLHHLNQFLAPPRFKIDNYKVAMYTIKRVSHSFAFDLKKGYCHIKLDKAVKDLFGFTFEFGGRTYFGHWTICPFGLSTIPYLFTKMLKPLLSKWRALRLLILIYLDDGLALCESKPEVAHFLGIV